MNIINIATLLLICLVGCNPENDNSKAQDHLPVNKSATPETAKLLSYLYSISGKQILSGQHNSSNKLNECSDRVTEITGKKPFIWGGDFHLLSGNYRKQMIEEAIRQYKEGSIIALMWHAEPPSDLGLNKVPRDHIWTIMEDEQWNELQMSGTVLHEKWLTQLDEIAGYLKRLKDENIPVLWRPYHEMNGGFWWCKKIGEDGFVKLWKSMYDRFVNFHHLDNLIWVWSPNKWKLGETKYQIEDYYPGDDYVDVLALDIYGNDYRREYYDRLLELADGKPIALGEVGQLPTPEILTEQPLWVWFLLWTNYIDKEVNSIDEVKRLYQFDRVLTK
ncbi:MAG: glycosyl hydrolase [Mangrovibacterium sp.]|nr:glycosyl hydrolase [Mangrovibacterium sp.]